MNMRMIKAGYRLLSLLSLISASLLLTACLSNPQQAKTAAAASDNMITPGFAAPAAGAPITVLPVQETQYEMLRSGGEHLQKQLKEQLSALGYRVNLLDKKTYAEQWQQEAAAVGGVYTPDSGDFKENEYLKALTTLMWKTCADTNCALMFSHRLVIRPLEISKGTASWDGWREHDPKLRQGDQGYGVSVELTAITPKGELGFKTFGAVAMLNDFSIMQMQQHIRAKQIFSEEDIARGVSIALQALQEKRTRRP